MKDKILEFDKEAKDIVFSKLGIDIDKETPSPAKVRGDIFYIRSIIINTLEFREIMVKSKIDMSELTPYFEIRLMDLILGNEKFDGINLIFDKFFNNRLFKENGKLRIGYAVYLETLIDLFLPLLCVYPPQDIDSSMLSFYDRNMFVNILKGALSKHLI